MPSSLRYIPRPAGPRPPPSPYFRPNSTFSSHAGAGRHPHKYQNNGYLGSPGRKTKKVRVTAVVGYKPDRTPVTTYKVIEMNSDGGEEKERGSTSSILSSGLALRTPSPQAARSMDPPSAPRIPFHPTPSMGGGPFVAVNHRLPQNVGLGIDFDHNQSKGVSTITCPENNEEDDAFDSFVFHPSFHMIEPRYMGARVGLGITVDGQSFRADSGSTVDYDTPVSSEDDEQAYYHLPSNLLSPDLVMSTEEFRDSLHKWMERRKMFGTERWAESDVDIDEQCDSSQEQAPRRKSV